MPIKSSVFHRLPVAERRVYRLSLTVAFTLLVSYAIAMPLPFIAPLFALIFSLKPVPPMGLKGVSRLAVVVLITLGQGMLFIPVLQNYRVTGFLLVSVGVYLSNTLTLCKAKGGVATFMIMGLTMITTAGLVDFSLARSVITGLLSGITMAIACQWVVYPLFPEDPNPPAKKAPPAAASTASADASWMTIRSTLIVLPVWFMALINPSLYMKVIMKAVSLGQQGSVTDTRHAGRELLGSTMMAGIFAILFWFGLKLCPTLWMYFLWMLVFGVYFSTKIFGFSSSRFPASFWVNVWITLLILIGPAVEDSANGDDVYKSFAIRMSLYIAVTLYAGAAFRFLEYLRYKKSGSPEMLLEKEPLC
jgi:hypothetical protein